MKLAIPGNTLHCQAFQAILEIVRSFKQYFALCWSFRTILYFTLPGHSRQNFTTSVHSRKFFTLPCLSRQNFTLPGHSRQYFALPGHSRQYFTLPVYSRQYFRLPVYSRQYASCSLYICAMCTLTNIQYVLQYFMHNY
jgi:hypothetical protein